MELRRIASVAVRLERGTARGAGPRPRLLQRVRLFLVIFGATRRSGLRPFAPRCWLPRTSRAGSRGAWRVGGRGCRWRVSGFGRGRRWRGGGRRCRWRGRPGASRDARSGRVLASAPGRHPRPSRSEPLHVPVRHHLQAALRVLRVPKGVPPAARLRHRSPRAREAREVPPVRPLDGGHGPRLQSVHEPAGMRDASRSPAVPLVPSGPAPANGISCTRLIAGPNVRPRNGCPSLRG